MPDNAIIYRRLGIGQGNFTPLTTTYLSSTNELSAVTTGFGEFLVAELAPPSEVTITNITTGGFTVNWESVFPEYRVLWKTGSSPTSPTDGIIILDGAGASATATGLSSSTPYLEMGLKWPLRQY